MPTHLPSAAGCSLQDAGRTWDAIRLPRTAGLAAMAILGTRCGALVEDPLTAVVSFFVPRGTAAGWDLAGTRPLGEGASVAIPRARCTTGPGPRWCVCPGDGGWLTDRHARRAAIEDACGQQFDGELTA